MVMEHSQQFRFLPVLPVSALEARVSLQPVLVWRLPSSAAGHCACSFSPAHQQLVPMADPPVLDLPPGLRAQEESRSELAQRPPAQELQAV